MVYTERDDRGHSRLLSRESGVRSRDSIGLHSNQATGDGLIGSGRIPEWYQSSKSVMAISIVLSNFVLLYVEAFNVRRTLTGYFFKHINNMTSWKQ